MNLERAPGGRGVPAVVARLDTASGREWVRRAVWAVAVVALLSFIVRGATRPEDPSFAEPAAVGSAGRTLIAGFGEVAFTMTDPAGVIAEWCALLADTPELRARGLMEQDDLNGYDAMLFRFEEPGSAGFWMKDTIIPLTVAYFAADGRFVSSADMQPCPAGTDCPSYPPGGMYQTAIEVPLGGLEAIGVGPGSAIGFGGQGCAAEAPA